MNKYVISEDSLHYVAAFMERYADKYPTRHHQDALADFRHLSNSLLETLELPATLTIQRHKIKR